MPREKDIFLVATYLKVPRQKSGPTIKGYMKDDKNISYKEAVTVTRGLKDKDLTANIILNLTQKTVYKCRFEGKRDWEKLAKYYADSYPQYFKLIDPPQKEVSVEPAAEIVAEEGDSPALKIEDLAEEK